MPAEESSERWEGNQVLMVMVNQEYDQWCPVPESVEGDGNRIDLVVKPILYPSSWNLVRWALFFFTLYQWESQGSERLSHFAVGDGAGAQQTRRIQRLPRATLGRTHSLLYFQYSSGLYNLTCQVNTFPGRETFSVALRRWQITAESSERMIQTEDRERIM